MSYKYNFSYPSDISGSIGKIARKHFTDLQSSENGENYAEVAQEFTRAVIELGIPLMLLPESAGGLGGAISDVASIAESVGYNGVSSSYLSAAVLNPLLQEISGTALDVEACTVVVDDFFYKQNQATFDVTIAKDVEGYVVNGSAHGMPLVLADGPIFLIAPLQEIGASSKTLLQVAADSEGVVTKLRRRGDDLLLQDFNFSNVRVANSAMISLGHPLDEAVFKAEKICNILVSVEAFAMMGALIEQTAEYLNTRVQFEKKLASFQALQHKLAEMYVKYELAKASVLSVVEKFISSAVLDENEVSNVRVLTALASRLVAHESIQLHGGMGMTIELPVGRLARRLLAINEDFGGRKFHFQKISI